MITVQQLNRYFGSLHAVADLSFHVDAGEVVGFIGANGAGKTTTLRMLVTLEYPDSGSITIDGYDALAFPNEIRSTVGWMPDSFGTYPNMDVLDYVDFFARAYGLKGRERDARIDEILDFTGLNRLIERPCMTLSKGETQRLSLARTLIGDPKVLILDEPAAGLDPKARLEFRNLVKILKSQEKTIFVSSHILSELGEMCDSLLFIDKGRLVHHGTADTLHANKGELQVRIRVTKDVERLLQWLSQESTLSVMETLSDGVVLKMTLTPECVAEARLHTLLQQLISAEIPVYEFHLVKKLLEEAFVDMLRDTSDLTAV